MKKEVPVNLLPVYIQVLSIFAAGIGVFLITNFTLRVINNNTVINLNLLVLITALLCVIGTLLGAGLAYLRAVRTTYLITDDAIIIKKKLITNNEKMYRFKDINSISLKQGVLGSQYNYGNVTINMGKKENTIQVLLEDVDNPHTLVDYVREHMEKRDKH